MYSVESFDDLEPSPVEGEPTTGDTMPNHDTGPSCTSYTTAHVYDGATIQGSVDTNAHARGDEYPVVTLTMGDMSLTIFPKGSSMSDLAAAFTSMGAELTEIANRLSTATALQE